MTQFVAFPRPEKHPRKGGRRPARLEHELMFCDVCRRVLHHPAGAGRRRKTCSDRCRQKLSRMRRTIERVTKRMAPELGFGRPVSVESERFHLENADQIS